MLLMSKKSRMSPAYDDSTKRIESIGHRWRNMLAEMTIRRDKYVMFFTFGAFTHVIYVSLGR